MYHVSVEEEFAAGHALRGYRGKCENPHGHNYKIRITVEGKALNKIGLLIDFVELKAAMHDTSRKLDHVFMNDVEPFKTDNPSAENIARFFFEEVSASVKESARKAHTAWPKNALPYVKEVTVWETSTSIATYIGERR
jgi:6-pyruvoyltetrahydropterin/6-carboxytetrahydropterin synthase